MVDYSKLSDFEINCEVAKVNEWTSKSFVHEVHSGKWNPCQNPADAWPIIDENGIALIPASLCGGWTAISGLELGAHHTYIDEYLHENFKHQDQSAFRAAMIVFLMMQEEKNG